MRNPMKVNYIYTLQYRLYLQIDMSEKKRPRRGADIPTWFLQHPLYVCVCTIYTIIHTHTYICIYNCECVYRVSLSIQLPWLASGKNLINSASNKALKVFLWKCTLLWTFSIGTFLNVHYIFGHWNRNFHYIFTILNSECKLTLLHDIPTLIKFRCQLIACYLYVHSCIHLVTYMIIYWYLYWFKLN